MNGQSDGERRMMMVRKANFRCVKMFRKPFRKVPQNIREESSNPTNSRA
jgi:hypothetical protein